MTLAERFEAKVDRLPDDCWRWTGQLQNGYGRIRGGPGTSVYAHRVAYELYVGPIPEGLQIDHLCRNRWCVNPAHLEVVTIRENVLRGEGVTARNRLVTHCPKGHPYDLFNTIFLPGGGRHCLTCKRETNKLWMRAYKTRKKAMT